MLIKEKLENNEIRYNILLSYFINLIIIFLTETKLQTLNCRMRVQI